MAEKMSQQLRELAESLAVIDPEMASIVQEMSRLESQGDLDEATTEIFQQRIQALIDRRTSDENNRMASLQSHPEPPEAPLRSSTLAKVALATIVFVVSGALLEATMGQKFIFLGSNGYWLTMPWLLAVLIPLFTWMIFRLERKQHMLAERYPTRAIRFIMFPLMILMSVGMVLAAPLGWMALFGWMNGTPADNLTARVVWIRPPSHSRGCHQDAEIRFKAVDTSICVYGRIVGRQPDNGDAVILSGRLSSYGLYVEQIRTR